VHPNLVNVTVTDGTVDLWGVVGSAVEKQALRVAVEVTPGVKAINDNVLVRPGAPVGDIAAEILRGQGLTRRAQPVKAETLASLPGLLLQLPGPLAVLPLDRGLTRLLSRRDPARRLKATAVGFLGRHRPGDGGPPC
jgi:hypothetical protein